MSIWSTLDIERTRDRRAIRAAYAHRLRQSHPEDDPAAFQALRQAYDLAVAYAEHGFDLETFTVADDIADRSPDIDVAVVDTPDEPTDLPAGTAAPGGHVAARGRLARLLAPGSEAAPEALQAAFDALVGGAALDDVGLYASTEAWLCERILEEAPRADPLIAAAIARFGWEGRERRIGADHTVLPQVMARWAAVRRLAQVRSPGHYDHAVWLDLARGPDWTFPWRNLLTPNRAAEVQKLLEQLSEGGAFQTASNAPVAAEWQAYFQRMRLTPGAIWFGAVGGFVAAIALFVILLNDGREVSRWLILLYWAAFGGGAVVVKTYVADGLTLAWRRHLAWRAPAWARIGWAPATLALLGIAAFAGPSGAATAGIGVGGLAVLVWAHVTNPPGPGESISRKLTRFAMRNLIAVGWWAFSLGSLDPALKLPLTLAAASALGAATLGENGMVAFWYEGVSRPARIAVLGALLVAAGVAAAMFASVGDDAVATARAVAAIAALVLTARLVGVGLVDWMGPVGVNVVARFGWIALVLGNFLTSTFGPQAAHVVYLGGGWMLIALAAAGCLAALVPNLAPRR